MSSVKDRPITALEYGCGEGEISFELASIGANVVGIDISEIAIKKAQDKVAKSGLESLLHFEVMNAEDLTFQENSFDLIYGSAILHHLNIEKAYRQIHYVLKPGGTAIFLEPLGYNPLIRLYRYFTPSLRTHDEHPLFLKDINLAQKHFRKVRSDPFHLTTLLAIPFASMFFFKRVLVFLEDLDTILFRYSPIARLLAWSTILKLSK